MYGGGVAPRWVSVKTMTWVWCLIARVLRVFHFKSVSPLTLNKRTLRCTGARRDHVARCRGGEEGEVGEVLRAAQGVTKVLSTVLGYNEAWPQWPGGLSVLLGRGT